MKKNDIIEITIDALTGGGDGVGHAEDGRVVFVPNAAVNDRLRVKIIRLKPRYALSKIEEIVTPAAERVKSDCAVSDRCGGCVFRHISYEAECEIKYNGVKDSMNRIGGIPITPKAMIAAEMINGYRNKAQLPVGTKKNGNIICGFYAKSSHRIVPFESCPLQPPLFSAVTKAFCDWANKYRLTAFDETTGKGLLRHLYLRMGFESGELMVAVVAAKNELPKSRELIESLKAVAGDALHSVILNVNSKKTNVVLGKTCRTLFGSDTISDTLCGVKVSLSPLSFYQVNRGMAEKLYKKAKELAKPDGKVVLDLYCGAGTIGLSMAKEAKKIIGVEIVPQAVENAKENAKSNGIDNAEFICMDAANAAKMLKEQGRSPDVVLLDPPRKGCDSGLLSTIAEGFRPERIVYISCNDATLARDCKILEELGYQTVEVTPVDLFPRTGHVECVVLLTKVHK